MYNEFKKNSLVHPMHNKKSHGGSEVGTSVIMGICACLCSMDYTQYAGFYAICLSIDLCHALTLSLVISSIGVVTYVVPIFISIFWMHGIWKSTLA